MAGPSFVHLHTHSEYSLLDGAARLHKLVYRAQELGMGALALTDHGVMYGALDFYTKCKAADIKPIVGVEAYVAAGSHRDRIARDKNDKNGEKNAYHLLLLAKNEAGYKNLLKLTTSAAIDGFYYKPRIDHELLEKWHEGIVATSACLGGEVCQALLQNDYKRASSIAAWYRDLLGRDNYFIEIQDHTLPEQRTCNELLLKMARELKLDVICTNDVHYLTDQDAYAHDVLLCIGTGATIHEQNRLRYNSEEFYMKSGEQMASIFSGHPASLENTLRIAEMCDLNLEFGRAEMPSPSLPEGHTPQSYLRELAYEGVSRKVGKLTDTYRDRLEYELGIVEQTGFAQYFLIVRDFAMFARDRGIFFGVRGSAAGSLTSFGADITDIDPIDWGLTFERFLNPERIQMPDIDMDFEDARRSEVIEYVTDKYGKDHVAQIVTFGTLAARAALKDAGRALAMPIPDVNRIVAMIPAMPLHVTIQQALDTNPELKSVYVREPEVKNLVDTAKRLEGLSRHASVHAAGVVISHDPLVEYTPLQKSADGGYVTQYSAANLEQLGLLKMDFLGLINLSILGKSVENIHKTTGQVVDVQKLPLDDANAFELLGKGQTTGIFQLESAGMRRYVQELKPTSVHDLAAMVALYRPGPMAHIPTYIRAKHGLEKINYPHPWLKEVLEETYGVIVYQDQVMQIAQVIAGYTLGKADLLRRAMGKKKKEEMANERVSFIAGAESKGVDAKKAGAIFDLVEPFAGYAFNKAHAVCYANVAYQTAYLKANYPVEYMAALLACYVDKPDKMASCKEECRQMGIPVLPPDINLSQVEFTPEFRDSGQATTGESELESSSLPPPASRPTPSPSPQSGAIRYGLGGIKNAGRAAVDVILSARNSGGVFTSLTDFCCRTSEIGSVPRSTIEALIQCGAFDSIHRNRRALMETLDASCQLAANALRDRESGQGDLFIDSGDDSAVQKPHEVTPPSVSDYQLSETLKFEKDLLGLYLSDHPLRQYRGHIEKSAPHLVEDLQEMSERAAVTIGGLITSVKPFRSKKSNEPMAFFTLEDLMGKSVAVTVFPSIFREFSEAVVQDRIVLLKGRVSIRERVREDEEGGRNVEILAEEIRPLGNGITDQASARPRSIRIPLDRSKAQMLSPLRAMLESHPGSSAVYIVVRTGLGPRTVESRRFTVDLNNGLSRDVEALIGEKVSIE